MPRLWAPDAAILLQIQGQKLGLVQEVTKSNIRMKQEVKHKQTILLLCPKFTLQLR